MSDDVKAFGPSALVTPANALTMARLFAAPAFAVVVAEVGHATWTLLIVWCILAVSDGADGRLARWHGTTRSGAFLDPLADKFLVLGSLCALASDGKVNAIAVGLIGTREIVMNTYRVLVGRRGISIPARQTAKLKTVMQDLVVGFALAPVIENGRSQIVTVALWIAVALTIWTGIEYLIDARRRTSDLATNTQPAVDQHTI